MRRNPFSVSRGLRLIPIDGIISFAKINFTAYIKLFRDASEGRIIPGTLQISSSSEDGLVKKTAKYERAEVTPETMMELEKFKNTRFIALYRDEQGCDRVMGSPDWPVRLDYWIEGGVLSVTFSCEDTEPDGFAVIN